MRQECVIVWESPGFTSSLPTRARHVFHFVSLCGARSEKNQLSGNVEREAAWGTSSSLVMPGLGLFTKKEGENAQLLGRGETRMKTEWGLAVHGGSCDEPTDPCVRRCAKSGCDIAVTHSERILWQFCDNIYSWFGVYKRIYIKFSALIGHWTRVCSKRYQHTVLHVCGGMLRRF